MKLSHRHTVKDLWQHPVGHELLSHMLQKTGRNIRWIESPFVANLPAVVLDRYAFAGFAHFVSELCAAKRPTESPSETPYWWKEAILYEVFIPSFMDSDHDGLGDFLGVEQRLPYLSRLGVNTLWLCPVFAQGTEGGIANHCDVHSDFGTLAQFDTLVSSIHAQGMRVLLDINLSSVSSQHPWFEAVLQGHGHPEYFIWKSGSPPWEASLSEMNWRYIPQQESYCYLNNGRIALNWESARLRHEFSGIFQFWLQRGIDGFCLGGLTKLYQQMSLGEVEPKKTMMDRFAFEAYHTRLRHYIQELRHSLPQQDVLLLGKVGGRHVCTQTRLLTDDSSGGIDLLYSSGHLKSRTKEIPHLTLQHLRHYTISFSETCAANIWMALFFENHKSPRTLSRLASQPVYHSLLAKLLGTWLICLRGTPVLYQGEELGLGGFSDDDNIFASHAPFPWSGEASGGFSATTPWMPPSQNQAHLHAHGQMENPRSIWHHYERLISLRRQYPCLVYGSFNPVFTNNRHVLCFFRIYGNEKCYVEINLTEKQISRPGRISNKHHLLLSNYEMASKYLRPYEANVYLCENN